MNRDQHGLIRPHQKLLRVFNKHTLRHQNFYKCLDADGVADELVYYPIIKPEFNEAVCKRLRKIESKTEDDFRLIFDLIVLGLYMKQDRYAHQFQVSPLLWQAAALLLESYNIDGLDELLPNSETH